MSLLQKNNSLERSKLIKKYCLLSGILSLGVMLFVLIIHSNSLFFGDSTVLRMDLYHQYGPLYAELYDRITKGYSLVYSWTSGLGNSFLGNLFNYCCSPFALIMLLFGHKNMPEAIAVMITLKAVCSSMAFTYYINKSTGTSKVYSAAFGLLYTFSAYFVAYSWNIMWLDAMVVFPLVILGIERIIDAKKPMLYICALTYTMITNYYMAYMVCIISVLYFLFYYFCNYSLTDKLDPSYVGVEKKDASDAYLDALVVNTQTVSPEDSAPVVINEDAPEISEINNSAEEYVEQLETVSADEPEKKKKRKKKKTLRNSRFFAAGVIFAFSSFLAFCISAFSLLPVAMCLSSSSATSSSMPETFKTYFNMFDFIANHLPSVEPTIRSSGENVLPNVYCGLITLLLIPAYFMSDKIKGKQKILSVALLGVFYTLFNVNVCNYFMHGLHFPNDLPYRYSFAYSFILLIFAYKALLNIREFSRKYFIATGIGLFAFVVLIDKLSSKNVDSYTIVLSIIFAVAYIASAGLITSDKFTVKTIEKMLRFVIVVELCSATSVDFVMQQSKKAYTSDYNTYQVLKERTEKDDDELFYRTELSKLRARMDPSWYGYNGVSVFSSMAYEKTSALMKALGLFGNKINSYTYYPQTPVFNSFFSVKYLYDNNNMIGENNELYTPVDTEDGISSYLYKYYLPLAFSVDSDIKEWAPENNSDPFKVQADLLERSAGVADVFDEVKATDVTFDNIEAVSLSSVNTGVTFSTSKVTKSKEGTVTVSIDVEEKGHYYVYAGSTKLSSINFTAGDDFKYTYVSSSIQPFVLDVGTLNEGDAVRIEYKVSDSNDTANLTFCAAKLNEENFEKAYNKIKSYGTLELTEFNETVLSGKINVANDNAFIFTSIPFDKSWNVYVDGRLLKINSEIDPDGEIFAVGSGLIGFDIEKGEHEITFKYVPNGLDKGLVLSAVGIAAAALLLVYKFVFKKKRIAKGKNAEYFMPVAEKED